ncbi:hypothetical protein FOA52_005978 [Chlamydomonas sp. UWO 241]|nr:hypothetical protein FOA52_005978 [Chlamydomonas sp. UWO 241]
MLASGTAVGALCSRQVSRLRFSRQLNGNAGWMTPKERKLAQALIASGNAHVFRGWPKPGVKDAAKRAVLVAAASHLEAVPEAVQVERLRSLAPPVAPKKPHPMEAHSDMRTDDYYWLRDDDRKNADMLKHLAAENAYTKAVLADTEPVQEELYKEMRARIQEADQSVPVRHGRYFYYTRTLEGAQYKIHCRRPVPAGAGASTEVEAMDESLAEEVLLDENKRKADKGFTFYMVGGLEMSPDDKLMAWAEDTTGNERYTLHVMDVASGKEVMEPITGMDGDAVWGADNETLFYVTKDEQERPFKVLRHKLGAKEHVTVFEEPDDAFFVGIDKSRSEKIIFIGCGSAVTSEYRFIHADKPESEFTVVLPRVNDVQYEVRHHDTHMYLTLRDKARPNSELLVASLVDVQAAAAARAGGNAAALPALTVLLPHDDAVKLECVSVSARHTVVFKRVDGLQRASVHSLPAGGSPPATLASGGEEIAFEEPSYTLGPGSQGDFSSSVVRLQYGSLATPNSVIDFNMTTGKRSVKKVQPVLGGFNKDDYVTERQWATSHDGTKVPISIVYKKDAVKLDGTDNCLLYGYGSYEICIDPWFSSDRLSLLNRGFVFAIGHIRGGGEMGRLWYENGKYLKKKNTFLDFIACAEHLIAEKYTSPQHLAIEGRSAGGLLIGATVNMRPELFKAAIAGVPFVDVLTTMQDETIPLTVIEWEEWGNPADKEFYHYMKSYSPVDQVVAGARYPNMLVIGGLHDPRVAYWEPCKFVAKLREQAKVANLLVMKIEMGAGHFSVTGRFERIKEVAHDYAFLLKAMALPESPLA